jgi:hypothetical protein
MLFFIIIWVDLKVGRGALKLNPNFVSSICR